MVAVYGAGAAGERESERVAKQQKLTHENWLHLNVHCKTSHYSWIVEQLSVSQPRARSFVRSSHSAPFRFVFIPFLCFNLFTCGEQTINQTPKKKTITTHRKRTNERKQCVSAFYVNGAQSQFDTQRV